MSCELEISAKVLNGADRNEIEDELCTNGEGSLIPLSCCSQENKDSLVFYNSSNNSEDCAKTSKFSNTTKSCLRLTIDFLNMLFTNEKKQSNMKLNPQLTRFFIRMSIILISLVFVMQQLPLASASERLGNPYHILGVSRHATLKEIRKAYKLLAKEW